MTSPDEMRRWLAAAQALTGSAPQTFVSVVAPDMVVEGLLHTPGEAQIFGRLHGDARAKSIIVCDRGFVAGTIVAEQVVVYGRVEGRIIARRVHLVAGSRVAGEIIHSGIEMNTGAIFDGRSMWSDAALPEPQRQS